MSRFDPFGLAGRRGEGGVNFKGRPYEEVDLELRLGHKPGT